jgi:hypothetical protein
MKYLTIIALLFIITAPAHAYIDGGTGSYIVQMTMAGILAMAFSVKLAWQRLKNSFHRLHGGRSGTTINGGK